MNLLLSVIAVFVIALLLAAAAASSAAAYILTVIMPYVVFILFTGGFVYRIVKWAKAPVPFRIPTTCGQEKSLPWIQNNPVENPAGTWGIIGRMAGEVF
ncbi:MAG TPA: hypothetical protein P5208_09880, partial [Smithellaceae bacterium]|nr:hypothetical protein [Smithellaceae bacterium]